MLSRRRFLNRMLGASAALALAGEGTQGALAQTASGNRRRLIVDSQVHLWKADTPDRPWPAAAAARPQLPEPFTYDKLLPLMNEAGVDRVIIVPPSWEGDRVDYAIEAARIYPDRFGVMGRIPLANAKSADLLPAWKNQPGMLGMRVTFLGAQTSWLTDGTSDWFWPAAEKARIPVMLLALKMSELARIAERHPELVLIIDHMGLSLEAVKAGTKENLIGQTVSLAKYPNVSVKLSGIPAYSSEPYPFRDMTAHLRRVFDAYGPRRCYWGTDITNSFAKASYRQRITHFTEELDFMSEEDKDWIMGRAILTRLGWA